jgi:hypothetical protein
LQGEGWELESPVLPECADGGRVEETLTRAPATSVEGEQSIDEGAELRDIIRTAMELLVAKAGTVEKTVDDRDAMVPGFDEEVGSGEGSHGKLEFVQVGRVRKLFGEGGGGVEKLAISNGTIGGVEICRGEKLDREVGAARIVKFSPASSGDLGTEAEGV